MIIEICKVNESYLWMEQLLSELRNQSEAVQVIEYDCLDRCSACYICPYAIVDGVIIEAFTFEDLRVKILKNQVSLPESQSE